MKRKRERKRFANLRDPVTVIMRMGSISDIYCLYNVNNLFALKGNYLYQGKYNDLHVNLSVNDMLRFMKLKDSINPIEVPGIIEMSEEKSIFALHVLMNQYEEVNKVLKFHILCRKFAKETAEYILNFM